VRPCCLASAYMLPKEPWQGDTGAMALAQLREVFPDASVHALQDTLSRCHGHVEMAVEQFLAAASAASAHGNSRKDQAVQVQKDAEQKQGPCRPQTEALWQPSKAVEKQVHAPDAGQGLLPPKLVNFPLSRVPTPLACLAPNSTEFSWASLKTKTTLQGGTFGPDSGSTWLWFIVAELAIAHRSLGKDPFVDVHIVGSKFQGGWVRDPAKSVPSSTLRTRHRSMLQSALDGSLNDYGSSRSGTPEGFTHSWSYSDATWATSRKDMAWPTSGARWSEVKGKDRWRVDIRMRWHCTGCNQAGRYLVVAEQRAEKLNPNQYATAMRGAMVPVASDGEGREALCGMIRLYAGEAGHLGASTGDTQTGLMRWARKRPAPEAASPCAGGPLLAQESPEKQ